MDYSSSDYLKLARKYARVLASGKITPTEYANNLLSSACSQATLDTSVAKQIASELPAEGREPLMAEITVVLKDGFRFHELHYGGPGPSPEHREEIRDLYTSRVRSWAAALLACLKSDSN